MRWRRQGCQFGTFLMYFFLKSIKERGATKTEKEDQKLWNLPFTVHEPFLFLFHLLCGSGNPVRVVAAPSEAGKVARMEEEEEEEEEGEEEGGGIVT